MVLSRAHEESDAGSVQWNSSTMTSCCILKWLEGCTTTMPRRNRSWTTIPILPPADIASDHRFRDLWEIWLQGDHYKWRLMRANGVSEDYCTGTAPPYEKFLAWARTVPVHPAQSSLSVDSPRAEAILRHRRASEREQRQPGVGARKLRCCRTATLPRREYSGNSKFASSAPAMTLAMTFPPTAPSMLLPPNAGCIPPSVPTALCG